MSVLKKLFDRIIRQTDLPKPKVPPHILDMANDLNYAFFLAGTAHTCDAAVKMYEMNRPELVKTMATELSKEATLELDRLRAKYGLTEEEKVTVRGDGFVMTPGFKI